LIPYEEESISHPDSAIDSQYLSSVESPGLPIINSVGESAERDKPNMPGNPM